MLAHLRSNWTSQRAVALLRFSLIGAVLLSLLAAFHPRFPGDLTMVRWVQAPATEWVYGAIWLDRLMKSVSLLGGLPVVIASIVTVGAALVLSRRWREGLLVWMIFIPEGLVQVIQTVVDRPRPPEELVRVLEQASSGSFPSGHAYHGLLFLGLLIILSASIRNQWLRSGAMLSFTALLLLVGLSRVYLGTHWPSDVFGSALFAIPTLLLFHGIYLRLGGPPLWPKA